MRYNSDLGVVELSLAELCALAHQSGDLGAHARRPKREAERRDGVLLCNTLTYRGITYTVEGYADAVEEQDGKLRVTEIKTVKNERSAYFADRYSRLRCLGYFLAASRHEKEITLCMSLVNTESGEEKSFLSTATADELYDFYLSLIERAHPFAQLEVSRCQQRIPSVRAIGFPYPQPREGQVEMAERAFLAIKKGKRLFAQAPTGIGKTMSALYPAVKALGEGLCDRIFYLTPKASTRREAFAAAAKLFSAGARLRAVVLHAKEQMCHRQGGCREQGGSCCNAEQCPYAKGYYNRSTDALFELLNTHHGFTRQIILEVAKKHRVCPYELSLDLSLYCEIIICDYNYVFDPAVYLRRFFDAEEGERGEYVFLVDEAHNLPDRARDMHSMRLDAAPFEAVYAKVEPKEEADLEALLGGFLLAFRRLSSLCTENRHKHEDGSESGYYLNRAPLERFFETVLRTKESLDRFLKKEPLHRLHEPLVELLDLLRRFSMQAQFFDNRFLSYVELDHGKLAVQIFCLDPSGLLDTAMHRARASILFSATLTPLDYFADVLGGGKQADTVELPSPYDRENLCVTVVPSVSTRYEDREKSYRRIATLIAATVSAKAGNYIVYFPSYDYMERVLSQFAAKYPKVTCIVQQKNMNVRERDAFLENFKEDEGVLRVGFCVLGGSFSEGVDLPGSRLIGTVVVGVGIPGLSNERNMLRDYYEVKCERGYDYAYTYPGMNRVLQAAGRVIRRDEDRGVVVLIDTRYAEEPYLHLYPVHWEGIVAAKNAASLAHRLQIFWQKHDKC